VTEKIGTHHPELADHLPTRVKAERAGLQYVVALRLLLEPLQRTQALSVLPPADRVCAGIA
jgi:hypothetical protein